MINLPQSEKNKYKDFNREIKAYGVLYLATKTINNGEYVINYTPFYLNEENGAKILSFNINEKTDIYYTSLPYNTMTLEVDNEQGYFTDYDENSIIEQLNQDCYLDLYMNIDNGTYYKIMTMNFDKISFSDYERAKLSFYSCLGLIEKFELQDKYNDFGSWVANYSDLKNYIERNYNLTVWSDHPNFTQDDTHLTVKENLKSLRDFLITTATFEVGEIFKQGVLLTNNYNNDISFKAITNYVSEIIETDLQLANAIIKKENTYKGANYTYYQETWQFESSSETYTKILRRTLQSTRDTIIVYDDNYKLSDITINDITSSSNVTVSLAEMDVRYTGALTLIIQGNIGDSYDISINKQNIPKRIKEKLVTWSLGETTDVSKILEIQEGSTVNPSMYVFLFRKKPIKSYVEINIMGLPYLEIGDTLKLRLDNRNVAFVITEINTNYNDGLIQTIKGYELDWLHKEESLAYSDLNNWGLLFPSNETYPSENLYPNQLI